MKSHYEKVICLCCFLMCFVNIGMPSTSFNVFQPHLAELSFVGHANASIILAVRTFATFAGLFFVTPWYKKFSPRKGVFFAALLTSAGFYVYAFATNLPLFFVGALLTGFGYALGGIVAITLLLRSWYATNVGTAVGIATMGSGISALVLPPIVARIIAAWSLSAAFVFEASLALVFSILVFAFLRDKPSDLGLLPYSAPEKHEKKTAATSAHKALPRALPRSVIIALGAAIIFVGAESVSAIGYLSILLTTEGIDTINAAWVVSVTGLALSLGKFGSGVICDHIGTRGGSIVLFSCMIAGLALCCFANIRFLPLAFATGILMGFGLTLGSVGISLWSMEFCLEDTLAKTVRNFQICFAFGSFVFNFIPGPLAEITGGYTISYLIMLVLAVAAFVIVLWAYAKRRAVVGGE